ncbi:MULTISPECIES: AraC family transcriptional regulator [unclassified Pseudomonas]|uniref:AraC family transcriptional regulator n=1 Tax=unclassified Pseudomonas TaxID=196821 RepID=UPI00194118A7|nr:MULTISPECIES: AraC family transcriptional regulator [unclassified Pseudomonas]MDC0690919.1 AraC family transcriptional regulator [Mitsuaria sp. RG]MCE0917167.1 AraC family transcriptional regulator [Pseudomonas sp. NMI760_13]MCF1487633.1 AraC family transcriptional regulator [Pseudomonas sp. AA27]MCP8632183.1 AraC family transcriptional regulator [Pseudomonas sp. DVZ6]MDD7782988.1 AraC family transcriptional regulator [Pseudomonas sp. DVZ24]
MESRLLSEQSCVFHHADPYAVSDYVNRHVGQHHIGLSRTTHPQASLSHRKFAELDLCRISYGGSVRVTSPALETIYHLQVLLNGNCLWRGHQREHHLVPGELLLINPDDPVDLTYSEDCEKFILKLPVHLLDSICAEQRWQRPSGGVRFLRNHYRLEELGGFLNLLGMICNEAEVSGSLPRVQGHYSQIVASKLLTLMTTNVRMETLGGAGMGLERILDYVERNLKLEVSAEALAEQANMSVRSLYALFDRHLSTTPRQYIRQRKLERVQACLSDPSCAVRSVTELALDYGFLHLGRFSESYRQRFGELPSETLKRRG